MQTTQGKTFRQNVVHLEVSGVLYVVMEEMQSNTYPINQRFHLNQLKPPFSGTCSENKE